MLGPSETIGGFGELFVPVSPEHKIFSRKATATRPHPLFELVEPPADEERLRRTASANPVPDPALLDVQREADRAVLARFSPPGVLVDEDLHILQFRGRTDPYLAPAPGSPNLELLKMAREGLMVELRAAISQARAEDASVRRPAVRLERDGRAFPIEIVVVPLRHEGINGRFYLVLFEEHPTLPDRLSTSHQLSPQTEAETEDLGVEEARLQVIALRRELDATREYLQSVVEENEATTEELKSANEEILSSNEELQSTNEELQTAKEEMQSTNEELQTVNDELNHRNAELARINDDLVNLFGSVNIAIVMVSRDLRIRRFTTPAEKLLNLMGHDVGRPIDHIRPNVEVPDLGRHLAEVISTLAPKDLEVQGREGRWYSLRLRPYITVDNKIDGAVLAIVDIDEIKRSTIQVSRALDYAEAIVESVRQPLVVLDEELVVRRVNQAFCRAFRLSPGEAVGRPMAELGGGWADPQLAGALRPVLPEGRPVKGRELTADFAVIGRRTFQFATALVDWKGAGTPMILLAMDDITDRKREAERDRMLLRELTARIEAERANRKKDEFLAMLAHELRNPLSRVLNALLVLRSPGASPGDLEWATQIMERQVRHMARLIDDLLDVSRVMRGSIQLRTERVELGRIARQVVENARPFIRSRRHELIVSIPEQPIPMIADPVRVEQILTNLLHNAAKYTPEGGKISLTVGRDGGEAVVRVKDNGIGIERGQLGEVFELFMQADTSLDRSLGGLGIGLTLVKTLAELHGGSIQAFSEGPGLGSEFVVRLPEATGAGDGPDDEEDDEPVPPRRILIVDDSPDALRTMEVLLHRLGHDIRTAPDGASALGAVGEFGPDLVLLDLGLPGMDGYQVARRLRADPSTAGLTLVALSGYGQEEDVRRCRDAGFDDHAVKPVDFDRLRQLLRVRHGGFSADPEGRPAAPGAPPARRRSTGVEAEGPDRGVVHQGGDRRGGGHGDDPGQEDPAEDLPVDLAPLPDPRADDPPGGRVRGADRQADRGGEDHAAGGGEVDAEALGVVDPGDPLREGPDDPVAQQRHPRGDPDAAEGQDQERHADPLDRLRIGQLHPPVDHQGDGEQRADRVGHVVGPVGEGDVARRADLQPPEHGLDRLPVVGLVGGPPPDGGLGGQHHVRGEQRDEQDIVPGAVPVGEQRGRRPPHHDHQQDDGRDRHQVRHHQPQPADLARPVPPDDQPADGRQQARGDQAGEDGQHDPGRGDRQDQGPVDGSPTGLPDRHADQAADDGVAGADRQAEEGGGQDERGRGHHHREHRREERPRRAELAGVDHPGDQRRGDDPAQQDRPGQVHDPGDHHRLLDRDRLRADGRGEGVGHVVGAVVEGHDEADQPGEHQQSEGGPVHDRGSLGGGGGRPGPAPSGRSP